MIIGVVGKKRSGKDTIGDYLVKKYGFIRMGLADPIKEACKHIFLMEDDQLWGGKKEVIDERYGVTPREILQVMGTELFQYDIYNHLPKLMEKVPPRTLWINRFVLMYKATKEKINNEPDVVISDVRFKHEAKRIYKMGGKLIKVVRPGLKNDDTHASEQELDKIHNVFIIHNDKTIADLLKKVDRYIKHLERSINNGEDSKVKKG